MAKIQREYPQTSETLPNYWKIQDISFPVTKLGLVTTIMNKQCPYPLLFYCARSLNRAEVAIVLVFVCLYMKLGFQNGTLWEAVLTNSKINKCVFH